MLFVIFLDSFWSLTHLTYFHLRSCDIALLCVRISLISFPVIRKLILFRTWQKTSYFLLLYSSIIEQYINFWHICRVMKAPFRDATVVNYNVMKQHLCDKFQLHISITSFVTEHGISMIFEMKKGFTSYHFQLLDLNSMIGSYIRTCHLYSYLTLHRRWGLAYPISIWWGRSSWDPKRGRVWASQYLFPGIGWAGLLVPALVAWCSFLARQRGRA